MTAGVRMWALLMRAARWIFQEAASPTVVTGPPPSGHDQVVLHISFGDRPEPVDGGLWLHHVHRPEEIDAVVELIDARDLPVDGVVLWGVDTIPSGVEARARWLCRLADRLTPSTLWVPVSQRLHSSLRRLGCRVITHGGLDGDYSSREHGQ